MLVRQYGLNEKIIPAFSQTDAIAFSPKTENPTLCVYETVLDAMSHASLLNHYGKPWDNRHYAVVNDENGFNRLAEYLTIHPEIKQAAFCYEATAEGGELFTSMNALAELNGMETVNALPSQGKTYTEWCQQVKAAEPDAPVIPDEPLFYITLVNREHLYEGELKEIQIGLPCSAETLNKAMWDIGIDGIRYTEVMRFQDYSDIDGLAEAVAKVEDLDTLNYAASLIGKYALNREKYAAVMHHQRVKNPDLAHFVNTAANVDAYRYEPGIYNEKDLGHKLARENGLFFSDDATLPPEVMQRVKILQSCFDSAKFVRSHISQHSGQFWDYGYVEYKKLDFERQKVFSVNDPVPEAYQITKPFQAKQQEAARDRKPLQAAR